MCLSPTMIQDVPAESIHYVYPTREWTDSDIRPTEGKLEHISAKVQKDDR